MSLSPVTQHSLKTSFIINFVIACAYAANSVRVLRNGQLNHLLGKIIITDGHNMRIHYTCLNPGGCANLQHGKEGVSMNTKITNSSTDSKYEFKQINI